MRKEYRREDPVAVLPLAEYGIAEGKRAITELLIRIGALDMIKEGMRVVIKANLVSAMKPERGATTHPTLLSALSEIISERGATPVIGDSPGGLYNAAFVGRVYNQTGMKEVEAHGASLNYDFSEIKTEFPEAKVLKSFTYTGYLDGADLIINFAKLKSHGMMGMSAAAKNMFGAIPGIIKPEYHYRFPKYEDFANMIVDIDEYFRPEISIIDAVVGMEGNGPTAGDAKHMGFLLASHNPHNLDVVAAKLIGFQPSELPLLKAAIERDLCQDSYDKIELIGSCDGLVVEDFVRVVERRSLEFSGTGKNPIKRVFGKIAGGILKTKPALVPDMCVGCGVCRDICPAKAIVIENGKPRISRQDCIRCFCCQEFCPKSAMKVKRTWLASIFHRTEKKK